MPRFKNARKVNPVQPTIEEVKELSEEIKPLSPGRTKEPPANKTPEDTAPKKPPLSNTKSIPAAAEPVVQSMPVKPTAPAEPVMDKPTKQKSGIGTFLTGCLIGCLAGPLVTVLVLAGLINYAGPMILGQATAVFPDLEESLQEMLTTLENGQNPTNDTQQIYEIPLEEDLPTQPSFGPTKCTDLACLIRASQDCSPTVTTFSENGITYQLVIISPIDSQTCRVGYEVLEASLTNQRVILGQTMACQVPTELITEGPAFLVENPAVVCEGTLKAALTPVAPPTPPTPTPLPTPPTETP